MKLRLLGKYLQEQSVDGVYREPVYTVESFVSRRRVGGSRNC